MKEFGYVKYATPTRLRLDILLYFVRRKWNYCSSKNANIKCNKRIESI